MQMNFLQSRHNFGFLHACRFYNYHDYSDAGIYCQQFNLSLITGLALLQLQSGRYGYFLLLEMGKSQKDVVPYWRVVKPPKGYLYDKYLGMKSKQRGYLKKEGFKVVPSGTKKGPVVKDFEKYLV